jgi:hypothetical protein
MENTRFCQFSAIPTAIHTLIYGFSNYMQNHRPFLGDLVAAWDMLKTARLGDGLMHGVSIYGHNRQPFFGGMRAGGWKICMGTDTMHFSVLIYVQCEFP